MGPFEPFDPASAETPRRTPVIYVLSAGRLILNAAAARLIGDTEWVRLYWEEETKRIGLKPESAAGEGVFRVTRGESQATITSKAFVDAYKLPYKKRMRLEWDGTLWVASTEDPANPLGTTSGK
jgi:hypothetical protein